MFNRVGPLTAVSHRPRHDRRGRRTGADARRRRHASAARRAAGRRRPVLLDLVAGGPPDRCRDGALDGPATPAELVRPRRRRGVPHHGRHAGRHRRDATGGARGSPDATVYSFADKRVRITLTFLAPALPWDLDLLSRPITYLTWTSSQPMEDAPGAAVCRLRRGGRGQHAGPGGRHRLSHRRRTRGGADGDRRPSPCSHGAATMCGLTGATPIWRRRPRRGVGHGRQRRPYTPRLCDGSAAANTGRTCSARAGHRVASRDGRVVGPRRGWHDARHTLGDAGLRRCEGYPVLSRATS